MAKKRPEVGDYCRNRVSGKLHKVTKLGACTGYFKLDNKPGWAQWRVFVPVPTEIAEAELAGEREPPPPPGFPKPKG